MDFDSTTRKSTNQTSKTFKTDIVLPLLPQIKEGGKTIEHNEEILSKINGRFGLGIKKATNLKKSLYKSVNFMSKMDFYFN
jgi:hypothetical protein